MRAKTYDDIERIAYWWARYGGIRDEVHGKIFRDSDINELIRRLECYRDYPDLFNYDEPEFVDIEEKK